MDIRVLPDPPAMGAEAAALAVAELQRLTADRGRARMVLATGASQFEMLKCLTAADLPWQRITAFHLDEYVGLPVTHPASFRGYLRERFVGMLPGPLGAMHYVDGEAADLGAELARLNALVATAPIDLCLCGIGENCHLAFNDPPADFEATDPYILVELDEACRRQQVGEGWFASFEAVPTQAISMTIAQMMACTRIICTVPDERKATAVRACVEGPVTNLAPASILQQHPSCTLVLDESAAAGLGGR